jgi:hypothetical protein
VSIEGIDALVLRPQPRTKFMQVLVSFGRRSERIGSVIAFHQEVRVVAVAVKNKDGMKNSRKKAGCPRYTRAGRVDD